MSKTIVSASAVALPNRRLFLAAGPAVGVFLSLRKAAAEESPLPGLIAVYEKALAAFEQVCDFSDFIDDGDPVYVEMEAKCAARSTAEAAALMDVCAYQCRTLDEARLKAEFLDGLLTHGVIISDDQWSALLCSFRA